VKSWVFIPRFWFMICFTEIRLSQAQTHAKQYGKLGIGFERDFIMDKGGRPVIYIPYKPKNGGRLLEDEVTRKYFSKHRPMIATLDDCGNF
jgi:hypothetical protein